LSLMRVEGAAWVLVIAAVSLVARADRTEESQRVRAWPVFLTLWATGCVLMIHQSFRVATYQAWVANTALVKVGFGVERFARGVDYLVAYGLALLVPMVLFVGAGAAVRRVGGRGWALVAMAVAFPAYAVMVGGDYMTMGRLLVPGLPFSACLFGCWLDERSRGWRAASVVGLSGLAVLPSFNIHLVPAQLREAFHFRGNKEEMISEVDQWAKMKKNALAWEVRGRALADHYPPEHAFVAAAIGAVGYHSSLFIYDRNGLVTREVALLPHNSSEIESSPGHDKTVPREFFFKYLPEIFLAKVMDDDSRGNPESYIDLWDNSAWFRAHYVPDLHTVDVPGVSGQGLLVVFRTVNDGESAPRVWAGIPQRLSRLNGED